MPANVSVECEEALLRFFPGDTEIIKDEIYRLDTIITEHDETINELIKEKEVLEAELNKVTQERDEYKITLENINNSNNGDTNE